MRWKRQQDIVYMYGTVNCAGTDGPLDAQAIIDTHNAECDKYEAELAELRDKLETSERQRNEGACYFDELTAKRDKTNRNLRDKLQAAYTTMDRLRGIVPYHGTTNERMKTIVDILYPEGE